jgi:AraC-like DNA-binding protein
VLAYLEQPPRRELKDVLVCTWHEQAPSTPRSVLPDACIDIVWDGTELTVAGPDTGPIEVASDAAFVGIRFRPGIAPFFLGTEAAELRDRNVWLAKLWGRAADELAEQLCERPEAASDLLQDALLRRGMPPGDTLVPRVLDELRRPRHDSPGLDSLARRLDASERTLRRHCLVAFGYGPKTLERILRFRRALRLVQHGMSVASVAHMSGYADQAHLSREFQRLAGATPGRLTMRCAVRLTANGVN